MFKNLTLYRTNAIQTEGLEQALQSCKFTECTPSQERSWGWIPARGEADGAMAEHVNGHIILRFMTEAKKIPGQVLARRVAEKAARIEQETGRKPGRKETRELKEEARLDLLPQAFTVRAATWVWIDPASRLLAIDTTSQSRADEIVTSLVELIPGLSVAFINTQTSPQAAMSLWLDEMQDVPQGFYVDRHCVLKSNDESKAVVKYDRHPLDIAEVMDHIAAGKLPTELAMTWDGRVSFVLTDSMQVRKIQLLDVTTEGSEGGFDADVAIATGELAKLVKDLIDALGGEQVREGGAA